MSLRQLRELQAFCTRLCKAGILKYPDDDFNKKLDRGGRRVKWTQLTQHEICNLIIKKIIPRENSCSWAEVVADGKPQTRDFFCSHNWGECFRDFMVSIEAHAKERGVALEDTYWICVYANNQHNVELGLTLQESPFYSALKGSKTTLLLLDKTAEALLRLWCVFELHATLVKEKQPLELWTPLGKVGSGLVSSGPVVQALNRIDTCRAKATNPVDQRQILNHIADVGETTGIKILENDNGKMLNQDLDIHKEGVYEQALIKQHKSKFEDLNKEIINSVTDALDPDRLQHLRTRNDMEFKEMKAKIYVNDGCKRGITLKQLRDFHQKIKCDFENNPARLAVDGKGPWTYDTADIYAIQKLYIDGPTKQAGCSFMELISDEEQRPEYHVIYGSQITFKDFMAALEWHAEARQLPDSAVYFFVPFMLDPDDADRPKDTKFHRKRPCTREVLEQHAIGVIMLVDAQANVLERSIPAWEAHQGISRGLCFDLAAASGALATTKPFANNAWEFGDFDASLARLVLKFDVVNTKAGQEGDKEKFLGEIAGMKLGAGAPLPSSDENYNFRRLNTRLRQKVAGPMLRDAGFTGDIDVIKEVLLACPNLSFGSESLKGTLGETAVHTAAASGHTNVIRLLLTLKAVVDPIDIMGGTPLHYAAMAGQAETARLLLEQGADPEVENFDAETPLCVAKLSPAYFLPIDMQSVVEVLEKASEEARGTHDKFFSKGERNEPSILHDKVSVLRVENWNLRTKIAELYKDNAQFKAQLALSKEEIATPKDSVADDCVAKIKQSFTDSGLESIPYGKLQALLCKISGLGEVECQKLISAASNAVSCGPGGEEIHCDQFLDWLMGSLHPRAQPDPAVAAR